METAADTQQEAEEDDPAIAWMRGAECAPNVEGRDRAVRMGFLTGVSAVGTLRWRRVRRRWVLIDRDAAKILVRPTREVNRFVERNPGLFPSDFCFRLTKEEWDKGWPRFEGGREGSKVPVAYSEAGLLQLLLLVRHPGLVDLVRWLAGSVRQVQITPPEVAWLLVPPRAARGNGMEEC